MRPNQPLNVDEVVYYDISIQDEDGVALDADSNPTVEYRIDGSDTLSSSGITVAKVAATTGLYEVTVDLSTNASIVADSNLRFEETATISAVDYINRWSVRVRQEISVDANGTAEANLVSADNGSLDSTAFEDVIAQVVADAVWDETQSTHTTSGSFGELATELAAVKAITDQMVFTVANELDVNAVTVSSGAINDVWSIDPINVGTNLSLFLADKSTDVWSYVFDDSTTDPSIGSPSDVKLNDSDWTLATRIAITFAPLSSVINNAAILESLVATDQIILSFGNKRATFTIDDLVLPFGTSYAWFNVTVSDVTGSTPLDTDPITMTIVKVGSAAGAADQSAIKAVTDQFVFTVANQVDANALSQTGSDATAANQTTIIAALQNATLQAASPFDGSLITHVRGDADTWTWDDARNSDGDSVTLAVDDDEGNTLFTVTGTVSGTVATVTCTEADSTAAFPETGDVEIYSYQARNMTQDFTLGMGEWSQVRNRVDL